MKRLLLVVILVLFFKVITSAQSDGKQDTSQSLNQFDSCKVGFCLIVAEADSATTLPVVGFGQRVVRYDYRYLRDSERSNPRYLLLPETVDVPLVLSKTPKLQEKGENGFPELQLELTPEAAQKLEKLTREHLGGKVAFVIDGEPITLHKIRSVITNGQFRLSRCTDTACQYIYGRLAKHH